MFLFYLTQNNDNRKQYFEKSEPDSILSVWNANNCLHDSHSNKTYLNFKRIQNTQKIKAPYI